jgi:CHAT domain-containing protein/lipopolysaccharide biosynthesis regulator YciM
VSSPPPAAGPAALVAGVPVEGEIAGGEVREHRIPLRAATYARVVVDQAAVDVALELHGPDGTVLAQVDSRGGHREPEILSWLAPAAGSYRLLVRPHDPQAARGVYAVLLEETRPAAPGDTTRIATEWAFAAARQRGYAESLEDKHGAVQDLQKVLAVWQEAGDRLRTVQTLNELGNLQARLGDDDAALAALTQALDGARALGDRREQARALDQIGPIEQRKGSPKDALLERYNEALRLWREVGDPVGEAQVLYNLGILYAGNEDFAAALDSYEKALALQQGTRALADQSFTLVSIGLNARDRGDVTRALDCFTRALELSRRSGDRAAEAYALFSTGSFHLRRGELQKAIELFTAVLDLYRVQGDLAHQAGVLTSLGSANVYLGDLDRAWDCYQEALAIQVRAGERVQQIYPLLFLGRVLQLRGDLEGAVQRYSQALAIAREVKVGSYLAQSLYFLGRADLALGRTADGVRFLEEALDLSKGNVLRAQALIELGGLAHARGDDERAGRQLQEALDLARGLQNFVVEVAAQGAIARLERDRGRLTAARAAIEEALRILDTVRSKVASQRLRVSFFASQKAYYGLHLDILMRLYDADPAGGFLPAALAASEQARARGLLDLLAEGRIDVRQGIAADLKQREEEIDSRITAQQTQMLDHLSAGAWDAAKAADLDREIRRAEEDREELEWEIRRRQPRYAAVRYPEPLRLEEIQALLDDRSALLEYAVGEERSFLFVVTREGLTRYVLPSAAQLAEEVRRIRVGLETQGRRNYGLYVATAWNLYRELIAPAADILTHKPRLIISPDGPLHYLSFEALLTASAETRGQRFDDLPYLIRERSVTYVPSASVLAELAEPREGKPAEAAAVRFLGFGDPVPAVEAATAASAAPVLRDGSLASMLPGLGRLVESRREVSAIAGLYGPNEARLYLDRKATEENVKDNALLLHARRIHFATHGLLDEKQPELSGLALTRAPGSREDGLLQVYEIFNLQLDADLVVLSACDSGLGTMVNGEGLVGVTRALLYAGAHSVVVSLWNVDDASTPDLMLSFYRHLDEDLDKAESLRLAKLEMIRRGHAHPFQWAPFVLIGEPR